MDNLRLTEKFLQPRVEAIGQLAANSDITGQCDTIASLICTCLEAGNKIMLCGNGGSAADAQHLAAEFSGKFYLDRAPLPAMALHVNSSYLTAVANDISFDEVYSRLVEGMGKEGDILLALSTSGNSVNVIRAVEKANRMGITTIALTGAGGGTLKKSAAISVRVPSDDTPLIQEMHIMLGHIICQIVEAKLFGNG